MSSDLSLDSTTDADTDWMLAPPLNYSDWDWRQMTWRNLPSMRSEIEQRIIEVYHAGNHVLAHQLAMLYVQIYPYYDVQLAKSSKSSKPNIYDSGIPLNQLFREFHDRLLCEQKQILYDAGIVKSPPPPLEPISTTNFPALWAWQTYCSENGIALSSPKSHSGGFQEFWHEHRKAIIIAAAVIVVAVGVAVVIVTTAATGTSVALATGAAAVQSAIDSYHASEDCHSNVQNMSCSLEVHEGIHNFAKTIQATHVGHVNGPLTLIETSALSSEITPDILTDLATNWSMNLPPIKMTTAETSVYGTPSFLANGVVLNGQQYAYSEFLRRSKQEEFFTNFLDAASPTRMVEMARATKTKEETLPSTSIPNHPTMTQPIPPQPGSSFTHRFFEMLGREILGEEIIADVPASTLQQSHLFTTAGERQSSCRIGGINGINTPLGFAIGHADYIAQLTSGHSIDWVYNNSHGVLGDLAEVFTQNYLGISLNTASLLTNNWVAFHEENKHNPKARYLQLCHSQGAIHVKNALMNAPKEIRDRVIVVAIAPAAIISKSICSQAFNYASKKDIVPLGELIFAGAIGATTEGTSPALELALEHHKEMIWLDPHPDAIGVDHDFQSPTFKDKIIDHIESYFQNNGKHE